MKKRTFRRDKLGCTYFEQQTYEVQWYRLHGKYPDDRIQVDSLGREYVLFDRAWNARNHYRRESIGEQLASYVYFRVTGIKR